MKHSDFKIGDAVIRRWNNQLYYIGHDVDYSKQEFLIDRKKDQKLGKFKVCEFYENLRFATKEEIECGYALVFEWDVQNEED